MTLRPEFYAAHDEFRDTMLAAVERANEALGPFGLRVRVEVSVDAIVPTAAEPRPQAPPDYSAITRMFSS